MIRDGNMDDYVPSTEITENKGERACFDPPG
jgi:hypothetical protein